MKAAVITQFGDASVLQLEQRPTPTPQPNEVLIKVCAAGINRADIAQRKGHYPAPAEVVQDILGLEVSGTIEALGTDVTEWKIGQEVCALLPGGGYAEYAVADAGSCFSIPKNYSLCDASSLPEVLLTVWQNIFQIGQLQPDETILIYGGSGGIGSMAIQLVSLFGAHPVALASSSQKIAYCQSLGAEKVVNYKTENLVESLGKNSLDLILDSVGGDYLDINLALLKPEGRLVYINAMEGKASLNIFKLLQKRIHLTGSALRSRTLAHKRNLVAAAVHNAISLIERPAFKNMVSHRFSIDEVVQAHQLMDDRNFLGKIILTF